MMTFFYIAAVILLLAYCFMLLLALIPFLLPKKDSMKLIQQKQSFVSVIVAARNEEKNIFALLESLFLQNLPKENYEIIIVSDNSTDNTLSLLEEYKEKNLETNTSFYAIENQTPSKKVALEYAVEKAKGEILIFTDADCIVDENWISSYVSLFQDKKLQFATGKINLHGKKSLLYAFQQMEWSALMAITASSAYYSFPLMANGANMAIRRQVFLDINPYESNKDIASGDDMFLLAAVKKRFGAKAICFNSNAQLKTAAAEKFFSFIKQRIRWAKKNYFSLSTALLAAVFVLLSQMAAIFLLLTIVFDFYFLQWSFFLLMAKFFLEFSLILCYKRSITLLYFPLLAVIYPFYVCFVAFASPFIRVRWKSNTTKA